MPNRLLDPGFELSTPFADGGWSYVNYAGPVAYPTVSPFGGSRALVLISAFAPASWPDPPVWKEASAFADFTTFPGEQLRIALWARLDDLTSAGQLQVELYDYTTGATQIETLPVDGTLDWHLIDFQHQAQGTLARLTLRAVCPLHGGAQWAIDDVNVVSAGDATEDPDFQRVWAFGANAALDYSNPMSGAAAARLSLTGSTTSLVLGVVPTTPGDTYYLGAHAKHDGGAAGVTLIVENPWPGAPPETLAVTSRVSPAWQPLGGAIVAAGQQVRVWISAADVGAGDGAWIVDGFRLALLATGGEGGIMALSKTQIVNLALSRVGVSERVTNIESDQTLAAEEANLGWDTVLEQVLQAAEWNFATKRVNLADLGSPPDEWTYRYAYPDDCLKGIMIADGFQARLPEDAIPWQVETDADGKVILTDQPNASFIYVGRVTDTSLYPPAFVRALTWALAEYLAMPLTRDAKLQDLARANYQAALSTAAATDANEGQVPAAPTPRMIQARR